MVPSHSLILFLSFVLSPFVQAAPWIVTDVYEQRVTTDYYGELTTEVQKISPTASLPSEALSTITSTNTDYDYTIVQKLYPTGYGKQRGLYDDYRNNVDSDGNYLGTLYKVNLTYSAPTACSTQWTTTTGVEFYPPDEIATLLPRDNIETTTIVDDSRAFQPTTYIYEIVFVEPTQLPTSSLNSLSYYNAPTSVYSGAGCEYTGRTSHYGYSDDYNTGETASGSDSTDSDNNSNDNNYNNYGYYGYYDDGNWFTSARWSGIGISYLALTLICVLGWVGLIFILGMIEAWVRFRRLMTGWQTRRGLPLFWAFIWLPLSLFFLFCFRKGYRARSKEDAEILKQRWDAMGFWTKIRLFFAWGFCFKYPTVLGPAPALVKTSKRPTESGPRLLDPTAAEMSQAPVPQAQPYPAPLQSGVLPAGHGEETGPVRYA